LGTRLLNILQGIFAETSIQDHQVLVFVDFFSAIINPVVNLGNSRTEACELCATTTMASAGWAKRVLSQKV